MSRFKRIFNIITEFGGLLAIWLVSALGYGKYIILAALIFAFIDILRRYFFKLGFPRTWYLFNSLAIVLSIIDILMTGTGIKQYESIIDNITTSLIFIIGTFGSKPLVQELAEQRQGYVFSDDTPGLITFFRIYTWIWAAYFILLPAIRFYLLEIISPSQAQIIGNNIGMASLFLMIIISFLGKSIFKIFRKNEWIKL